MLLVNDSRTVADEANGGDVLLSDPNAFGGPSFDLPFGQITRALADELLAANPLTTRSGLQFASLDAVERGDRRRPRPDLRAAGIRRGSHLYL